MRPSLNNIASFDGDDMDCFYGLELPKTTEDRKYFFDMANGFNKITQENYETVLDKQIQEFEEYKFGITN